MYELVILGFLMRGPMHGYLMAKIINDMIGPFARLSNGRLYPLLNTLERDGLVARAETAVASGDRQHRSYQITEAGRQRFHELMLDTTSNPGDYQRIFWHKLPYFDVVAPTERIYLLDHFINLCQTHVFHVTHEIHDYQRRAACGQLPCGTQVDATVRAMEHLRAVWQLELDDARSLRADAVAKMEGAGISGETAPFAETAPPPAPVSNHHRGVRSHP